MRSILYTAAALMIGASVYGFVDYSKTKDKKEFAGMYDEKETIAPVVTGEKEVTSDVVPVSKKEQTGKVNNESAANEKLNKKESLLEKIGSKFKKKRKANYKSFSRAALEDEVIVEMPEVKKETGTKQ